MYTVYILQSIEDPTKKYVGFTGKELPRRLEKHQEGFSPSTSRYAPWEVVWSCQFSEKQQAIDFEAYLKSGSGRAFASKRLLPCPPTGGLTGARGIPPGGKHRLAIN